MLPQKDILPLIPQRAPFVMIDELIDCNETGATTAFGIVADNIFVEEGVLGEPALVENIAQTAAARMGYICQQEQKSVPVGFIGVVQNLVINKRPLVGDQLKTTISIKNQVFNATIINGEVHLNGEVIASCDMKIFTP